MKKMLVCLLTVLTVGLFAQDLNWNLDFKKALDLSRKSGKPVFAFFTGSDWCGWCKRLDREILSKRDMIRYLNDNFILFKADFPRKNQPPKHVTAFNHGLMKQYGVNGFPSIIITDSTGKAIGRTGYMKGGPSAMKKALNQYISHRRPAPKTPRRP